MISLPNENLLAEDLEHVLAHTCDLWEDVRGQNIFVTGGTGFFGRWLLESFAQANRELRLGAHALVLTRNPAAFRAKAPHLASESSIELIAGNATTFPFPKRQCTHVIHAATETDSLSSPLDSMVLLNANVEATRRVLEFSAACGAQKLLFTSSGAIYGTQPPEITRVSEDYVGAPSSLDLRTAYGQSKRFSEFLCAAHGQRTGLGVTIARCFAFVGPHLPLDANYAVGNFTRDALGGGPILINGDGSPRRSYLYAADLAIWLWTILLRGKAGQAYNVGSDVEYSIVELAKAVAVIVCPKAEVMVSKVPKPGVPPSRYVPSIDKAREDLGLEPWIDLPEGIRRMAVWNRSL